MELFYQDACPGHWLDVVLDYVGGSNQSFVWVLDGGQRWPSNTIREDGNTTEVGLQTAETI